MNRREVLTGTVAVVVAAAAPSVTVEASELLELNPASVARVVEATRELWRVFRVSEYEWYVARNGFEALAAAARDGGCQEAPLDPAALLADLERDGLADEMPWELNDEALDRFRFVDVDEEERPEAERSFRAELERRIVAGLAAPELFAATDW